MAERHTGILIAGCVGALTMVVTALFTKNVLDAPEGFVAMKYVSNKVRSGARTFLHTEYFFIAIFCVCMFVFLIIVVDVATAVAYVCGATISASCGGIWAASGPGVVVRGRGVGATPEISLHDGFDSLSLTD